MISDTIVIAFKAILANKLRSFLTMLGVIIGVSSVVLLTSIGTGLQAYVADQFNQLGANTLIVFPGNVFGDNGSFSSESQISGIANSTLRYSDVKALERLREDVSGVAPLTMRAAELSFQGTSKNTSVMGTTANFSKIYNTSVEKGQFFSDTDDAGSERVIVLGYELAKELFGNVDPVGKTIKVGSQPFRVIGVAEKKGGGFGGPSFDTYAYIPFRTYSKIFDSDTIIRMIVKTTTTTDLPKHVRAIESDLATRHEEDDFSVVDQSEILSTINQILSVLTVALGGISGISLVVGGIGIMNIMLVSVTERTREIGLRKALGATPNLILLQFLIEASVLSVIGGSIGLAIAFGGTQLMKQFIPAAVTPQAVALAFGVSLVVGLVFGAAPARRAANLSPIEALRYE